MTTIAAIAFLVRRQQRHTKNALTTSLKADDAPRAEPPKTTVLPMASKQEKPPARLVGVPDHVVVATITAVWVVGSGETGATAAVQNPLAIEGRRDAPAIQI